MGKRIEWLDTAKGIAMIMVVMGHVVQSYHNVQQYETSLLFNFTHRFVYSFHMALFMVISGILLHVSMKKVSLTKATGGVRHLLINKAIAYLVPYIFFSFVWWSFKMAFAGQVNSTLELKDLLLIFIYPISFMWFLYALFIIVLVQVLIGKKAENKTFALSHLTIALALFLLQPYLVKELVNIRFSDLIVNDIIRNYLYFLIGFYYSRWIIYFMESKKKQRIAVLSGLTLFISNIVLYNHPNLSNQCTSVIIALSGCIFSLIVCSTIDRVKVLSIVGKYSLSIYVLQGLTIAATRQALNTIYHPIDNESGWIPMITCTLSGIFIPLLLFGISTKIWKLDFVFTPTKYLKF